MIALDAVLTVRIEKIVGTRVASRSKSEISFGLWLIARKHENSELGFSLLEPSCLKLSISGFMEEKNMSQKSLAKSWSSNLLRAKQTIFRHKDRRSFNCLIDTFICKRDNKVNQMAKRIHASDVTDPNWDKRLVIVVAVNCCHWWGLIMSRLQNC